MMLNGMLRNRKVFRETKLEIHKSTLQNCVLYGAENPILNQNL